MDIVSPVKMWETVRVRWDDDVCFAQIHRPEAGNTIGGRLIDELTAVLDRCEQAAKIVVLEGSPEVFCLGADFNELERSRGGEVPGGQDAAALYDLWQRLASGSFISVAHVRGRVNAGGVGFVAACDVVVSEEKAVFSLSELLFGLMPACVLPFLIRRIGFARANYMTLMTQPITAKQAAEWGLVDVCDESSENALRKQLLRLRRLTKPAITRYKRYMNGLEESLPRARIKAVQANRAVFGDADNLERIALYVTTGRFPWEAG